MGIDPDLTRRRDDAARLPLLLDPFTCIYAWEPAVAIEPTTHAVGSAPNPCTAVRSGQFGLGACGGESSSEQSDGHEPADEQ